MHHFQCLDVEYVDAASSIHVYLLQLVLVDDETDDKSIGARMRDHVRVIAAIPRDGCVRTVQELRHTRYRGVKLAPSCLFLPRRIGCQVDYEAFSVLGELAAFPFFGGRVIRF